MHLVEAIDRYLMSVEAAGYSRNTTKAYSTRLTDFAAHMGHATVLPIDTQAVQQYLGSLRYRHIGRRVGVSDATLAHAFATLSGFFRFAERNLRVEPNPMRDVMKPRGQTSVDQEFKSITLEELDRLLDVALNGIEPPNQTHSLPPDDVQSAVAADRRTSNRRIEDYLLVAFMGLAGLRVSEVCGIDLSDIHEDTVTVLGKGRKRRTVPLAPEILCALEQYTPPADARHLFGSIRDPKRRLAPASVEQRIPRLATWAGIFEPRVTPHVLRHTFGSLMLAADPTALIPTRDLMGHESVETTNKYAHTRDADRRLALSSMQEMRNRRKS